MAEWTAEKGSENVGSKSELAAYKPGALNVEPQHSRVDGSSRNHLVQLFQCLNLY